MARNKSLTASVDPARSHGSPGLAEHLNHAWAVSSEAPTIGPPVASRLVPQQRLNH